MGCLWFDNDACTNLCNVRGTNLNLLRSCFSTEQNDGVLGWPLKLFNCRRSKVCLTRSMPPHPNRCIFLAFMCCLRLSCESCKAPSWWEHCLLTCTKWHYYFRDANLWRSKIWRLSFFHPPLPPPPPGFQCPQPPTDWPSPQWEWLRTLFEVLHELHTIKICNHRFDARNDLCQWINMCKNAPETASCE